MPVMSRKNDKARKLKRNKKVRNARRAAKSKWKWVVPILIAIALAALTYYKIALTYDYTATYTLYNKMDNVHIVTRECVTGSSKDAARTSEVLIGALEVCTMSSLSTSAAEVESTPPLDLFRPVEPVVAPSRGIFLPCLYLSR